MRTQPSVFMELYALPANKLSSLIRIGLLDVHARLAPTCEETNTSLRHAPGVTILFFRFKKLKQPRAETTFHVSKSEEFGSHFFRCHVNLQRYLFVIRSQKLNSITSTSVLLSSMDVKLILPPCSIWHTKQFGQTKLHSAR